MDTVEYAGAAILVVVFLGCCIYCGTPIQHTEPMPYIFIDSPDVNSKIVKSYMEGDSLMIELDIPSYDTPKIHPETIHHKVQGQKDWAIIEIHAYTGQHFNLTVGYLDCQTGVDVRDVYMFGVLEQ